MQLSLIALLSIMKSRGIHTFQLPSKPMVGGMPSPGEVLRLHPRVMRDPLYTLSNKAISLLDLEKRILDVTNGTRWEVCEYPREGECAGINKPFLYLCEHAAQPSKGNPQSSEAPEAGLRRMLVDGQAREDNLRATIDKIWDLTGGTEGYGVTLVDFVAEKIKASSSKFGELWKAEKKRADSLEKALNELAANTNVYQAPSEGVWVHAKYCRERLFHAIAAATHLQGSRVAIDVSHFDESMAASNPVNDYAGSEDAPVCKFEINTDEAGSVTINTVGTVTINAVGDVTVNAPEQPEVRMV